MTYEEHFLKQKSLMYYLEHCQTGTAQELAQRLDVSRRTVFHYLEAMRLKGFDIQFDKTRNSYFIHSSNKTL